MIARRRRTLGATLLEVLAVLALLALLLAGAVAGARAQIAHVKAGMAAEALVSEIRLVRSQAIGRGIASGLQFVRGPAGEWLVAIVEDGDGDGLRSDDLRRGVDRVVTGPQPVEDRYGARLGFHPSLTELNSPPPVSGRLAPLDDPVRLGLGDIISCSPTGAVTSGTLYVTDGQQRQFAVVVYGATARLRMWEYDLSLRTWLRR